LIRGKADSPTLAENSVFLFTFTAAKCFVANNYNFHINVFLFSAGIQLYPTANINYFSPEYSKSLRLSQPNSLSSFIIQLPFIIQGVATFMVSIL
jgi:hypothetical protein